MRCSRLTQPVYDACQHQRWLAYACAYLQYLYLYIYIFIYIYLYIYLIYIYISYIYISYIYLIYIYISIYCLTHVDAMWLHLTRMHTLHCATCFICIPPGRLPPKPQEWCGVNGGWALAEHGAHCSLERHAGFVPGRRDDPRMTVFFSHEKKGVSWAILCKWHPQMSQSALYIGKFGLKHVDHQLVDIALLYSKPRTSGFFCCSWSEQSDDVFQYCPLLPKKSCFFSSLSMYFNVFHTINLVFPNGKEHWMISSNIYNVGINVNRKYPFVVRKTK